MRPILALAFAVVTLALATATFAPGAGAAIPLGPYEVTITSNVRYGPDRPHRLDLCRPRPVDGQWRGPFPGIVFVHGGAWVGGDKKRNLLDCQIWGSYGFVAVTINYRLITGDRRTWWPAQIVDAQAAVRWLRSRAAEFDLDRGEVCAQGDSAGGQLAQYLGYESEEVPGDLAALYPGMNSHVQCVISEFGPSTWGPGRRQANAPDPRTLMLLEAEHDRTAATLLVQGTRDTQVKPEESRAIYDALEAYGRPVKYKSYKGGHEFKTLRRAQIDAIDQIELDFAIAHARRHGSYPD